jgi:putative Mg2+ transporter-C (MgtC) family protein
VLKWRRNAAPGEAVVRNLLRDSGMKAVRLGHVISQDGKSHEHHMKVKGAMPLDVDGLVARLSEEDDLAGFSVMPRDE